MGHSHSFDDAGYATVIPAVGVPMLDWPADLFGDDASLAELVAVDIVHPAFLLYPHQTEELRIQIAA